MKQQFADPGSMTAPPRLPAAAVDPRSPARAPAQEAAPRPGSATPPRGTSALSACALVIEIWKFALPATVVLLASAAALLVDTYFVTGLGSAALAGVSLVFPCYLLLVMAFGGGLGVGLSVVLAMRLGRGDQAAAQRAVGSALGLTLGMAALFLLAFVSLGERLFAALADDPAVVTAAMEFARPLFWGGPIIAGALTLSNVLRSEKRVGPAALLLLVSGGVNAALNPLLIQGLWWFPRLGVAGAGVATVVGFAASAALGMYFLRPSTGRRLVWSKSWLQVDWTDLRAIATIAVPTLGTYLAANGTLLVLSGLWASFGTEALAGYGLAARLEYLLIVVIYGVGAAILTLGGEALGAGQPREFARICGLAAASVVLGTTALAIGLLLAPSWWFELFGASPMVVSHGRAYLKVAAWGYPLYALALTLNYGYQTMARAHLPLLWTSARGFAVAVPLVAWTVARGGSVAAAAVPIAASFILLGLVSSAWFSRTLARATPPRGGRAAAPPAEVAPDDEAWRTLPALPATELAPWPPGQPMPLVPTLKASSFAVSPYPLSYTLRWPWYFRHPSIKNHSELRPAPVRFARPGAGAGDRLRICAMGDVMVMQRDRVPAFAPELQRLLGSADLLIGTCEAAMGRTSCDPGAEHHFLFNMPSDYLRGIIEQSGAPADRWFLSISNNHSGDIGPDGLASTMRRVRALGATPLGARVQGEPPCAVVERKGLRLGLAAWTNWLNLPEPRAWRSDQVLQVPWPALREQQGLDALIGSGHWEFEWQHFPRRQTRELARQLSAVGFDLLIGSHTHTLQPLEWIDDTLCAYSLGNFCSGLGVSWAARMCNVLAVELALDGEHRGKVVGYEVHLFVQLDDGERVSMVPLAAAPAALRAKIERRAGLVLAETA